MTTTQVRNTEAGTAREKDDVLRLDDCGDVLTIDELAGVLKTSRRTLERLRRARALPIPELRGLDKRPRWSRDAVERYLAGEKLRRAG